MKTNPMGRKKKKKKKFKGLLPMLRASKFSTLFVLLFFVFLLYMSLFRKNAIVILQNDKAIAAVSSKKFVLEQFIEEVKNEWQALHHIEIKLLDVWSFEKRHVSKKKLHSLDYAKQQCKDVMQYEILATAIFVDQIEMIVVKNNDEAEQICNRLKNQFTQDASKAEFVEVVELKQQYVNSSQIQTAEEAYKKLSGKNQKFSNYSVLKNDNADKIATKFGITREELLHLNPEIEPKKLKIGQQLKVKSYEPYLSVKTVETITKKEPIHPPDPEIIVDGNLKEGAKIIEQNGLPGEKEVTEQIEKINGREVKRIRNETVIKEAIRPIVRQGGQK